MFKMSTCNVKEPTHYSKRVGHEVPGVVLCVLLSSKCGRLGGDVLKRLVVYEPTYAKTVNYNIYYNFGTLLCLIEDELLLLRHQGTNLLGQKRKGISKAHMSYILRLKKT